MKFLKIFRNVFNTGNNTIVHDNNLALCLLDTPPVDTIVHQPTAHRVDCARPTRYGSTAHRYDCAPLPCRILYKILHGILCGNPYGFAWNLRTGNSHRLPQKCLYRHPYGNLYPTWDPLWNCVHPYRPYGPLVGSCVGNSVLFCVSIIKPHRPTRFPLRDCAK